MQHFVAHWQGAQVKVATSTRVWIELRRVSRDVNSGKLFSERERELSEAYLSSFGWDTSIDKWQHDAPLLVARRSIW